jgi:hypothetical protein
VQTNKKVEKVAETLRMINPNFTISESYLKAYDIIKSLEELDDFTGGEPTG